MTVDAKIDLADFFVRFQFPPNSGCRVSIRSVLTVYDFFDSKLLDSTPGFISTQADTLRTEEQLSLSAFFWQKMFLPHSPP
jgi:hypothetical protein